MNRYEMDRRVQVLKPGRSVFDLSYAKKMSGRMGYLYPMMVDEMVPGDVFDLSAEAVIRLAPMKAPMLHEVVLKADWFFVPYRIMVTRVASATDGNTEWEKFITGGQSGADATALTRMSGSATEGDLKDHLGFPPGPVLTGDDQLLAFPLWAYNIIYNEYYRDPNLEAVVALSNTSLLLANWDADYFTRALPWQQRSASAPALPVSGSAYWGASVGLLASSASGANQATAYYDNNTYQPYDVGTKNFAEALDVKASELNTNVLTATSVNVADLRLTVQLQRWLERNARSGYRYTEFLQSHFGVSPRDDRLDRPEYIGGLRQTIIISEVLQTSESGTTPQGTMAGHGILAGRHSIGRYHAKEFGVMMCLMSVIPRTAYQQGIDRQWLKVSKYDFYFPEFANLSEQGIYNEEIYAVNTAGGTNRQIWGYQGRYDHMRSKQDKVAGAFRSTLNYWHLGRIFGSLPALNSTFGHVDPTTVTSAFAVADADNIFVHWGNRIRAIRPLPPQSNPGRIDHDYGGY